MAETSAVCSSEASAQKFEFKNDITAEKNVMKNIKIYDKHPRMVTSKLPEKLFPKAIRRFSAVSNDGLCRVTE